jgi:hypothetical protein
MHHSFAIAKYETADQANAAVAAHPTLKSGRAIKVELENLNKPFVPRFDLNIPDRLKLKAQ